MPRKLFFVFNPCTQDLTETLWSQPLALKSFFKMTNFIVSSIDISMSILKFKRLRCASWAFYARPLLAAGRARRRALRVPVAWLEIKIDFIIAHSIKRKATAK